MAILAVKIRSRVSTAKTPRTPRISARANLSGLRLPRLLLCDSFPRMSRAGTCEDAGDLRRAQVSFRELVNATTLDGVGRTDYRRRQREFDTGAGIRYFGGVF